MHLVFTQSYIVVIRTCGSRGPWHRFALLPRPTQSTTRNSHVSNLVTLPMIANSEVLSCAERSRKVRYPRRHLQGVVQQNPGRSDRPNSRKVFDIMKCSSSTAWDRLRRSFDIDPNQSIEDCDSTFRSATTTDKLTAVGE